MRAITRQEFLKTPAGSQAKRDLQHMVNSSVYSTRGVRTIASSDASAFVERHISYLVKHPHVNPAAYLSNLRVMTKISH